MSKASSRSGSIAKVLLKKDLKAEIAKLATKEEIAKLATKEEIAKFATKIGLKTEIAALEGKIDVKAKQYRDDVLNKLDEVMGELETIREDNVIGNYQSKNLSKKVDDHEKRIEILEQSA